MSYSHRLSFAASIALVVTAASLVVASPAHSQWTMSARRWSMGGARIDRGSIKRYNPAYRGVPGRATFSPSLTLPVPLGLVQALGDSGISFDPSDSTFNAVEIINLLLEPPVFLELRKPTVGSPGSDISITIGQNSLQIDLGEAREVIPAQDFEYTSHSRPIDLSISIKGVRVGLATFIANTAVLGLDDNLRSFLREAEAATPNTRYGMLASAVVQSGIAPAVSYSLKIPGTGEDRFNEATERWDAVGFYVGVGVRYYIGLALGKATGAVGFTTADPIFSGPNAAQVDFNSDVVYQELTDGIGRGLGVDLGIAYVTPFFEAGFGITDVGTTTLTWSNVTHRTYFLDDNNEISDNVMPAGQDYKTTLPQSYMANVAFHLSPNSTVGANVIKVGSQEEFWVGGEQWLGMIAVRGGLGLDGHLRPQYGAGVGIKFGFIGFDIGIATHNNTISGEQGMRFGTSIAFY